MRLSLAALVTFVALGACASPAVTPRDAAPDAWRPDAAIDAPAFSMAGTYTPVIATKRPPPAPPADEPRPASLPTRAPAESRPAIHGTSIASLAVTDDGRAAVTVDRFGAVRLWPTLDGKVEPVVVTASHPAQLAIARSVDRFVIGALDRGGTLEFLTVKPTGARDWRARIDETRPFVSIAATLVGFVAVTDDQRIAVFSLDGAPRGHLIPDPGEHIVNLVHRGVRALALVSAHGAIHGRWVTNDGWAGETPRLPIDPSHAALTPDGARLAASRVDPPGIATIDLATGKTIDEIANDPERGLAAVPLGFIDAHRLAVVDAFTLGFAQDGAVGPMIFGDDRDRLDIIAFGDNVAVVARPSSLVLAAPGGAKVLGYKLALPTDVRALDHGALITDGASLIRIDDRFAERERYALPPGAWSVIPLDAHRALAMANTPNANQVVAVDLDDPDASKILVPETIGTVSYQPETRLYAVATRTHVSVGRYDPRTGTFEGPIEIPFDNASVQLVLAPRGAPLVVAVMHDDREQVEIREIAKLDFAHHAFTAKPTRTTKVGPEFWSSGMTLPGLLSPLRAARGALVAEIALGRITLHEGGTVRWVVAAHGIGQLAWSARGELVGRGNGLVHLDLDTGAFTGPHCGWGFGIWDEDGHDTSRFSSGLETVCDVE